MKAIQKKLTTVLLLIVSAFSANAQYFIEDTTFYFPEWSEGRMLEIINDTLVIAGGFETVGLNNDTVNHIVKWDGINFHAMGSGNTNWENVFSGIAYQGYEYYCGGFHSMGNVPQTHSIAGWDGSQYFSIGDCASANFYDIVVWHDTLFVGGDVGTIEGHTYFGIAAYNGTYWIDVGILDSPRALAVYNDQVYAVGGSAQMERYLGGTSWESIGTTGFYGKDLVVDTINNFLYTTAGATAGSFGNIFYTDGIALWNGFYWEKVGYGYGTTNPGTNCLAIYRGDIYISPGNDSVGGVFTGRLARWDGQNWFMVGDYPGLKYGVGDLKVYKDELYLGGVIHINGTDTLGWGVVRWYMPPDTTCKYLKPRVFTENNLDTFYMSGGQAEVQFFNNNAYVQTWDWDFGDTGSGTVKDPVHIYTDTGTYNV
ncbi:MAG: PKD domain-containing protein, partial [Bacteroidota bacterium]